MSYSFSLQLIDYTRNTRLPCTKAYFTAEHGAGKKGVFAFGRTAHYLEHMIGKRGIEQIAGVKRAFDPNTILNIGNMGILGR